MRFRVIAAEQLGASESNRCGAANQGHVVRKFADGAGSVKSRQENVSSQIVYEAREFEIPTSPGSFGITLKLL